MNSASTVIAILPEAGLATVTGGNAWMVSVACWAAAPFIDALYPGMGARFALSCLNLII